MSLVRFEETSLEFGDQKILSQVDFAIEPGERVCLIGRNGAGKSTTLKLITGEIEPDSGDIVRKSGLVVSQLVQSLPEAMDMQVSEVVHSGLAGIQQLLEEYRSFSQGRLDKQDLHQLEQLHQLIDAHGGWHIEQHVETIMTELNLPADKKMSELSGGWRRRVALAKALVQKPDLLLLDEPTNHLDITTIKWLENIVYDYPGAVIFITHDRAFLQRLATRILEIDRGKLTSWPGAYNKYLIYKEKNIKNETLSNAKFDKKIEQEEIWIRQGIKARRTRNEGRVRALMKMREERSQRVAIIKDARMHIEEAEQSGRKVIRARKVNYRYHDDPLIENFSIKIMRGDRIGLLGNNGVGKTTLLRLLLGELEPQSGTIKHGANLEIGYFDQLRQTLDLEKSVAENVGRGRTYIKLNGKDRHIIGYLKGFLFSPKRSMMPVKALSGGERNRIILAKLFTQPANLLILDEPTNDLDMETLDVLEQKLVEFNGTLIIVSHDRQFLDNVITSTLVFEADGSIQEYVGGYSDWIRQGKELAEIDNLNEKKRSQPERKKSSHEQQPTKLSYKEQRKLEQLPSDIERLETIVAGLEEQISAIDFYSQNHAEINKVLTQLAENQETLDKALECWAELEQRQQMLRRDFNSPASSLRCDPIDAD
jgi:ATP-binding cassette subfamily F protein uup